MAGILLAGLRCGAATFAVTNAADSGAGTLRAAITNANAVAGSHTITFSLAAPYRIALTSGLPALIRSVLVDGSTQPGYAGTPLVQLDGTLAGVVKGLTFQGPGGGVQALRIAGFTNSAGVELAGPTNRVSGCWVMSNFFGVVTSGGASNGLIGGLSASNRNVISANRTGLSLSGSYGSRVQGNYVGLTSDGLKALSNSISGVDVYAPGCLIGGSTTNARNVIAACGQGIHILSSADADGVTVSGNYIGTDVTGTNAIPISGAGVRAGSVSGGVEIGGVSTAEGNIICSCVSDAVQLLGNSNTQHSVMNNRIGLGATGLPLPNGKDSLDAGVYIESSSNTVAFNVISGNSANGIRIVGGRNNLVLGNLIGTDAAGATAVTNKYAGVVLDAGASFNQIGSALYRNIISGNNGSGGYVNGATSTSNSFYYNYIGTDITGRKALGNGSGQPGIGINQASGTLVSGNLLSGNYSGVEVTGSGSRDTRIDFNLIGTDVTATNVLTNSWAGIVISAGSGHRVGTGGRNVVGGNTAYGVDVNGSASNVVVAGNYIGVSTNGQHAVGNGVGIRVYEATGANVCISNNVISGNLGRGILFTRTSATNAVIADNLIGLSASGSQVVSNRYYGIDLDTASNVRVGGASAGERNVIAGNGTAQVRLAGAGSNGPVVIAGNYIGLSASGASLPGGMAQNGILSENSPGIQIGGPSTLWRNVIGGCQYGINNVSGPGCWISYNYVGTDPSGTLERHNGIGIYIYDSSSNLVENNIIAGNSSFGLEVYVSSRWTRVRANRIGFGSITALPNGGTGIHLFDVNDATIGGTSAADGNLIAFNGGSGIAIQNFGQGAMRNLLLANLIYSNSAPGIDLGGTGVTANDAPPDADTGPNGLQNYPVLAFASAGATNIAGKMSGAGGTLRFEFFALTPAAGALFLGATNHYNPPSGVGAFSFNFGSAAPAGSFIVATATSADGTSEFSAPISLSSPTDADGDKMPDWWETAHLLNPAVSNAPNADADSDGITDLDEWIADTVPTDASSFLRIAALEVTTNSVVQLPTSATRVYDLQRGTEPGGAWQLIKTNIPGTGVPILLADPATDVQYTYRARARIP